MPPAPTSSAAPFPVGLVCRIGWLALLVGVAHFWIERHFGVSLIEATEGWVVVPMLIGFAGWLLTLVRLKGRVMASLQSAARWAGRRAVSPWFQLVASIAVFAIGSSVSSIQIAATGLDRPLDIVVQPELTASRARGVPEPWTIGNGETVIRRFRTNLFGRRYQLTAPGFRPHGFQVEPWFGTTLRVPEDLQRTPTVLVRMPVGWVTSNLLTGEFRLHQILPDGTAEHRVNQKLDSDHRAVLVGGRAPTPAALVPTWTLELAISGPDTAKHAAQLLGWQNPVPVQFDGGLAPGMRLRAEFVADNTTIGKNGVLAAWEFTVSEDGFQDILLVNLPQL